MRYLALATDYDGTLAEDGVVAPATLSAIARLRDSGRRTLLVTGRELEDLRHVFPDYTLFDRIVAENGAVVFDPETREERLLAEPPPQALVELLRDRGVNPLYVGRVIVATREPHEASVFQSIHELGLEHQVIFNKGAVMVLPSGINKAAGLRAALHDLGLSAHNTVGVGDAENDHALLAACEAGIAVQNALPLLKERADWVTPGARGEGVVQLVQALLASDLGELEPRLQRHELLLGTSESGALVSVHAYGRRLLLCGTSGSGKSTLAGSLLERLNEQGYQFCVVDPEGDFFAAPGALVVGDEQRVPVAEDIVGVLAAGDGSSVVAHLVALARERRPAYLAPLLARLTEHRSRSGKPHWIVVDEAHHMMPEGDVTLPEPMTPLPSGVLLITVHPERLALAALRSMDGVIVVGTNPAAALEGFARAIGASPPLIDGAPLEPGEAFCWRPHQDDGSLVRFRALPPKAERRRHQRKYATGDLGEDKSFYFRGPHGALNLRANNLALFLQMADGVDDATWLHHLAQGDYSQWLRTAIKNDELAATVERIERDSALPRESRRQVREAIERLYTLPA